MNSSSYWPFSEYKLAPITKLTEAFVTVMPTASAGGTAPNMMSRISIKMDDGTTQYVDTSVTGLAPGDRVEITSEGYLKR